MLHFQIDLKGCKINGHKIYALKYKTASLKTKT